MIRSLHQHLLPARLGRLVRALVLLVLHASQDENGAIFGQVSMLGKSPPLHVARQLRAISRFGMEEWTGQRPQQVPSSLLIASTLAADEPFGSNSDASHVSTMAFASSGPMTRAPMVMICALLDFAARSAE